MKVSSTNFKLGNAQTSIFNRHSWKALEIDNWAKSGMRHVQWTVNERKNMNFIKFSTIIRHLCRMRTYFKCSCIWNLITRHARMGQWLAHPTGMPAAQLKYPDAARPIYLVQQPINLVRHCWNMQLVAQVQASKERIRSRKKEVPSVRLDQRCRRPEIWRSQNWRCRVCGIVVTS